MDLFEYPEKQPKKVKDILSKPIYNSVMTYAKCEKLIKELGKIGYTCEHGLDASPFYLHKIPTKKTTSLVWEKHPDGGEYAKYKFGSIIKYKGKYQYKYFGTIGMVTYHATSLADAKKKLDLISIKKTKIQNMAIKKQKNAGKTTAEAKKRVALKLQLKKFGYQRKVTFDLTTKQLETMLNKAKKDQKGLVSLLKKNILFWEKELKKSNISVENKKYFQNEIAENKKVIANLEKPISELKAPAKTKGLTTLCAKQVGVIGRRKSDGTQKKGYVAKKGGQLVKKKTVTKKK